MLGVDHTAEECKGTDRSKACLKCTQLEHSVKECTNASYCPICNRKGHRAGNASCAKFRDALASSIKTYILQLNCQRRAVEQDLLEATAAKLQIDVIAVSEPNRKIIRSDKWKNDSRDDAALKIRNAKLANYGSGGGEGYVWIELTDVHLLYFTKCPI